MNIVAVKKKKTKTKQSVTKTKQTENGKNVHVKKTKRLVSNMTQ